MFKPTSINTSLKATVPMTCFAVCLLQASRPTAFSQPGCRSSGSTSEKMVDWWSSSKPMPNSEVSTDLHLHLLRPREKPVQTGHLQSYSSAFLSIRPVCPWAPHSARLQVPPDAPRSPRRHWVWHSAVVECSEFWLSLPALEGHQLLQQVSQSIRSHRTAD